MFIVKQSQNTKRKSRIMKAYDWFLNELAPQFPPVKESSVGRKLTDDAEPKFQIVKELPSYPEEDVDWLNDNEVEFKVIAKELNVERRRYLKLNLAARVIYVLTSTSKKKDLAFKFSDVASIERSLQDHRQIMLKSVSVTNIYLFTFSSVYKVIQFLELYNHFTVQLPLMALPLLTRGPSAPATPSINLIREDSSEESKSLQALPEGKRLRVLVMTFNMNRKQ